MPTQTQSKSEFYEKLQHGRTGIHPAHWPDGVEIISLEGLSLLGLDHSGHLYLDGERLYTARRLARQERVIAWIVTASTALAAAATAYQAWCK